MSFNLDDYEPVAARLERFWADHPNGRVITALHSRDAGVVVFSATVWFDRTDVAAASTGWASEVEGGRGVNATSALENCETSAIGRALANCNYAPKTRPSREEMGKEERINDRQAQRFAELMALVEQAGDEAALTEHGQAVADALGKKEITKNQRDRLARRAAELIAKFRGAL